MSIELSTDPTILRNQLNKGIKDASEAQDNRTVRILTDMSNSLKKWKKLTPRQLKFANSLVNKYCPERKQEEAEWETLYRSEEYAEKRQKAMVIAKYYQNTTYYAKVVGCIMKDIVPPKRAFLSMLDNPYAQKVLKSTISEPIWKLGDLVQLRSTADGRYKRVSNKGWTWQNADEVWRSVFTIIAIDSRPIDRALKYHEKNGGARYYRLLPLGGVRMIDVQECDIKKARDKVVYGGK